MGIWHKYAWIAYLAVFAGVCGHASSEFVSVLSEVRGPELSVWKVVPFNRLSGIFKVQFDLRGFRIKIFK